MKYLRTISLLLAVLTAAALFVACGDDDEATVETVERPPPAPPALTEDEGEDGSPTGGAGDGEPIELELAAENTTYDVTELTAPAGADVTLVFDNDDEGLQHNFALFESADALDDPIFEGDVITGVDTIDYEFTAPEEPGTYFYHCDIHPTQMDGDFIVE